MADTADTAIVDNIVHQFELSPADLHKVTDHFVLQLKTGLLDAKLPFQLPAFVTSVPDGSETGRFLSVDLGGTNCRICLVDLLGHGTCSVTQTKHPVPRSLMVHPRHEPLFDWLATCIHTFAEQHKLTLNSADSRVPLGFTFSFTCDQTSLSAGTLLHWDKGWDLPSALGHDPCRMLQDALDAAAVPVRVAVLANDSVGTLLAHAYTSGRPGRTLAGVIVGTGTNAAYVERLQHVQRYGLEAAAAGGPADIMIVNTEWGCLDDGLCVLPQTRFDSVLDAQSTDPGAQMLEKRVAGMYLGELFRLATVELYRCGGVFDFSAAADASLFRPDNVDSSLLSLLADDTLDNEAKIASVATALILQDMSPPDLQVLQRVAAAVMTRAARLVAAALAAIVMQSGWLAPGADTDGEVGQMPSSSLNTPKSTRLHRRAAELFGVFTRCLFPYWCRRRQTHVALGSAAPLPLPQQTDLIDVGITGSVIEFHPTFQVEMREALREIDGIGPEGERRIQTGVCPDGSVVGAALMAQAALSKTR